MATVRNVVTDQKSFGFELSEKTVDIPGNLSLRNAIVAADLRCHAGRALVLLNSLPDSCAHSIGLEYDAPLDIQKNCAFRVNRYPAPR